MTTAKTTSTPEGFDVEAVTTWVCDRVPGMVGPFTWTKLEGGHSNFTYRIDDARGARAVIRRPPLGELLPKAHDMGREFTIISALHPAGIPVAEPLAFCDDPALTGANFYVMSFVEGTVLYEDVDTLGYLPLERRPRFALSWMETLAALHALDPDDVGLGDLGRREDYIARQLYRWYESYKASATRDWPEIAELHDWLAANIPDQAPARVVHGDYGTHNVICGPDGTVAAVVDWEISTLGDPLADLGYAMTIYSIPDDPHPREHAATMVPGFPSRGELVDRYAQVSGRDLTDLDFYIGFNYWKGACIVDGVYARYLSGQKVPDDDVDLDEFPERIQRSLDLAVAALS